MTADSDGIEPDRAGAEPDLPQDVPGLDLTLALQRTGGNPALLTRLLRELLHDHGDDAQRIAQALADGRAEEARRLAHTLKGVAGTLGASALQRAATALEAALGPDSADEAGHAVPLQALRRALQPLMAGLRAWQFGRDPSGRLQSGRDIDAAAGEAPAAAVDEVQLRSLSAQLEVLLREMDPAASEVAEALAAALREDPTRADRAAALARHAAAFEFDEATACLRALGLTG